MIRDEEEEEDLVKAVVRLSARTADNRGTSHEIAQILHTLHVNIVYKSTMPSKTIKC